MDLVSPLYVKDIIPVVVECLNVALAGGGIGLGPPAWQYN